jgi:MFS-type transporter involved in bile tolerance (Atg22 family)
LLVLWMVVLALCAVIPGLGLPSVLFWGVAPLGGLAFGGTGTVDRALLLEISPPNETGTFFGLFAMVGRFSSILGPILWAVIADVLGFGRPVAVAALFVMASISWWIFRSLPEWLSTGRPVHLGMETAVAAGIPVP